jgi:hypothetical protein
MTPSSEARGPAPLLHHSEYETGRPSIEKEVGTMDATRNTNDASACAVRNFNKLGIAEKLAHILRV